jgi:hypothetical protein
VNWFWKRTTFKPPGLGSSSDDSVDRYRIMLRLNIVAAVGCFLICIYAWQFRQSGELLRVAGVGMLLAGASLLTGFLLGFIFGIPRMGSEKATASASAAPAGAQASAAQAESNTVTPNSNLVEISDWLTKILVGVSLVELGSIPGRLLTLSAFLGAGLRPSNWNGKTPANDAVAASQAAAIVIMLYFFTLGFLLGYIWTRLYFQRDLGGLVASLQKHKQVTDLIMLAEASLKEESLDEALSQIDAALRENPVDGRAILTKARILKRQALGPVQPAERERLLNEALLYANQASTLLPGKAEPIYNKACYQALLGVPRDEVLSTLKKAFAINPGLRKVAAGDPDLQSLQGVDFNTV